MKIPRDSSLKREPIVSIGGYGKALINTKAKFLLDCEYVAWTVSEDGTVALVPVKIRQSTRAIVKVTEPLIGAINVACGSVRDVLDKRKKYVCKWDEVNGRLIVKEGKR